MAKAVQQRRGTDTQHDDGAGFTGLEGEITVDTTNDTIRVHDNSTKGGHRLAKYSELGATITAADESSDTTCFPVFTKDALGALAPKTDASAYTYNASTGTLSATSYTGSQSLNNSITDTSIDATEFAGFVGTKIIYTGSGTGDIILPDAIAGDVGKSWIVINIGSGALTLKRDTNSHVIKFLNGSAVSGGSANLTLAVGSVAEIICIGVDNYITFGAGIS